MARGQKGVKPGKCNAEVSLDIVGYGYNKKIEH